MAESVIFAQQTVSGFEDGGLVISPAPFVPMEGEIYQVSWDGVEHICACAVNANLWGVPAISDVVVDAEGNPVSGTFAIIYYTAQELEAENDGMVLYSPDTTATEHTVAVSQIATTAIIENESFTSVLDAEFGYCYSTAAEAGLFEAGKQYAIVWDGAAHLCTAQDASAVMEGADCLIGNGTAFGLEGNGEPFIIGLTTEGVILFLCLTDTAETEHTVSLHRVEESSDSGGGTEEPEESYDDNDVSIKSYSQEDVVYQDVPKIWLKKAGSSDEEPVLVPFSFGEVVEGVQIQLDFSEGDQVIAVPEGQLVKEATIVRPEGLVPENIRQGAEIAGVPGEYTPETQEQEVALFMPEDDQVVLPTDGKFLSKVTIKKPETLVPENIAKDVEIGGIVGTHEGGGGGSSGVIINCGNSMVNMFMASSYFNWGVTVPKSVTNMYQAFNNCRNLNQPITIYGDVVNMSNAFRNCVNLNQPVSLLGNGADMSNAVRSCGNFNQPITIPNGVTNMMATFLECYRFNQPIAIPNSVVTMAQTFYGCSNFNQPITIPNGVVNLYNTFGSCRNFNQPITIPNSAQNASYMFVSCYNFNQPINIPNSVTNMAGMFSGCNNFNQPITVPNNVTSLRYAFQRCNNLTDITVLARYVSNVQGMMYQQSNAVRVNIRVPAGSTTNTTMALANYLSVCGANVRWTINSANKCRYNAAFNVYIYWE